MQIFKYIMLFIVFVLLILTLTGSYISLKESQVEETKAPLKTQKAVLKEEPKSSVPKPEILPKMSVKEKKQRYFSLVNPHIQKVYKELMQEYLSLEELLESQERLSREETQKIESLKEQFKVETNRELLYALKPHPPSIVLAQGALESSWGTSRFFIEANNIFGIWSANPDEPRIAAGEMREGKRTIWLRKFDSLEESVREYYMTIGRVDAYEEFRQVRYESDDPFAMIEKLDKYAEIGAEYPEALASLIRYNKLTKYDAVQAYNSVRNSLQSDE